MLDSTFVCHANVFAAQARADSDLNILMRNAFRMCDGHALGVGFRNGQFSLHRGRSRANYGFQ